MLEQGFYLGTIRHHRYRPKKHLFNYNMYWSLLDLDELEETFIQNKLWSYEKFNLVSFRKKDFHHSNGNSNKDSIKQLIKNESGENFEGRVYLLSHLRYLGFNFNSVCFYFCENNDDQLQYIVSEITNTPWGERHSYLHNCSEAIIRKDGFLFNFDKEFHISPFVAMDMNYQWYFKLKNEQLRIHMKISDKHKNKLIDVTFTAKHIPLNNKNMNMLIRKYPFQPLKMAVGIYWQAIKLWWKKTPFYSHPKYLNK